jgi:hypothetical protein
MEDRKIMASIKIAVLAFCLILFLGSALASAQQFGTKVVAGDPDVGLPLSQFSPLVGAPPAISAQSNAWVSYWDIGTTPGVYDDQDVAYLQFGNFPVGPLRNVKANDIRLTGWGIYQPGSYVKAGDADIGQAVIPQVVFPLAAGVATGFYYMNAVGGPGYDLGDPVYLHTAATPVGITNTNDIRITPNAGFPAGSRVSLSDSDANKPLLPFDTPLLANGGPLAQGAIGIPVARLAFYNANGNVVAGVINGIYDTGDLVYFDVSPMGVVSPNDIRLF